ncbi:MAG: U32 family peptidase [Gammaproteobacteria bacterium]|nr:MAG: U32 family peptidase [Gammaproteobacteria bacterium]
MKIVAPISRIEEIAPLAAAGADELYCSVVSPRWLERFHTSGISRRAFANLPDYADLERAARLADEHGIRLSLALNAQHYSAEQLEAALQIVADFDSLGGAAVIAGDPLLISILSRHSFRLRIHVSSIAGCRNSETAAFYRDLGAHRIIFPRDITLKEMAVMIDRHRDLEFESFVLNDGCVYEEGLCHTIHLPAKLGGPICLDQYQGEFRRLDGQPLSLEEQAALQNNEQDYQNWLWYRFGCGFTMTPAGLPYGPCALCALPEWETVGLHSIKIAGRDAPLARKLKGVEMVNAVRARLDQNPSDIRRFARDIRQTPDHCASGRMCYYPMTLPVRKEEENNLTPDVSEIP